MHRHLVPSKSALEPCRPWGGSGWRGLQSIVRPGCPGGAGWGAVQGTGCSLITSSGLPDLGRTRSTMRLALLMLWAKPSLTRRFITKAPNSSGPFPWAAHWWIRSSDHYDDRRRVVTRLPAGSGGSAPAALEHVGRDFSGRLRARYQARRPLSSGHPQPPGASFFVPDDDVRAPKSKDASGGCCG